MALSKTGAPLKSNGLSMFTITFIIFTGCFSRFVLHFPLWQTTTRTAGNLLAMWIYSKVPQLLRRGGWTLVLRFAVGKVDPSDS